MTNESDNVINTLLNDFLHYQLYKKEKDNFNNAYNDFTNRNKITPNEANALRHIGGSLYFGANYGNDIANRLGLYNEIPPQASSGSTANINDTKIDLYNNHIGRTQAEHYESITPNEAIDRAMYMIRNTNQPALRYDDERALKYDNNSTLQRIINSIKQ